MTARNEMEAVMGRPPIGKVAMTVAERVRRYRAKHATEKPATKPSALDGEGEPLAARIRELEAELARVRKKQRLLKPGKRDREATAARKAKQTARKASPTRHLGKK